MGFDEFLKFEEFELEESDLQTLEGLYLNDQVIGFYLRYLSTTYKSDDILLVSPNVSHGLAHAEDADCLSEFAQSVKLSSKRLVLFVINDSGYDGGYEGGSHWSTMVYDRATDAFLHLDSIALANNCHALKLYDTIKNHVGPGGEASLAHTSLKKQRNKKKPTQHFVSKPSGAAKSESPTAATGPTFKECEAPQQTNGVDCGLYVLAIAKAICQHSSVSKNNKSDLLSIVQAHVDDSVEVKMRDEVRDIIRKLSKENL